jgi:hypothetical protein
VNCLEYGKVSFNPTLILHNTKGQPIMEYEYGSIKEFPQIKHAAIIFWRIPL